MSRTTIIRNAKIINENRIFESDIFIKDDRIEQIGTIDADANHEIEANGLHCMPGIIDDQVHFREPGLTHKADIFTESRAAIVGGVTSFMEMPNTKPPAVTQAKLQEKYDIGQESAWANYSFYMGATNDNLEEVLKTDPKNICGVKIFMGSSTGNMLVDQDKALNNLFSSCPMLMATHCEDEETIRKNVLDFEARYGDQLSAKHHPQIRSVEGCYLSSSKAVDLANKYGSRLHILHISTEKEIELFTDDDRRNKKITSEACVHHMYFTADDYEEKGNLIKCNPAIKYKSDQSAIRNAVKQGVIDVMATDHAPHTTDEKSQHYTAAPSGLPLIQHTLHTALTFYNEGWMPLTLLVDKMCHAVADIFDMGDRGYIREGYVADLLLFDPDVDYNPEAHNVWSKCGWTPFTGRTLTGHIDKTILNGQIVVDNGQVLGQPTGRRLTFHR